MTTKKRPKPLQWFPLARNRRAGPRPATARSARRRWHEILAFAGKQHGLATRRDLLSMGIPAATISDWLITGRLHQVHAGVYAVGQPVEAPDTMRMAAVLACQPDAYLSHRCCCKHWALLPPAQPTPIEVTTIGRRVAGPRGVRVHSVARISEDELTTLRGVPVTTAARAVIDLAGQADEYTVAKAYEEGLIQGFYDRAEMAALVTRYAGRRGIKKVRFLVERDAPPSWTIGEAHKRLLELVRSAGLPHPETEVQIGPYRVDMLWRRERVIVEVDGATYHSIPSRIEADKRRDAELAARGYVVVRVTWRQLVDEPHAVLARITRVLARRAAALPTSHATS